MTKDDLEQMMHKVDLLQRPYIVYLNPADAKAIKYAMPDIEEKVVIQETDFVEQGKTVWVERKELDKWTFGYMEELT